MSSTGRLFEKKGYFIAIFSFIVTLGLLFSWTREFQWCFIASLINTSIIWGSYIVLRMCYLASR